MRTKKDFDNQNEYNKNRYDRIGLMLPKGKKEKIQLFAKANKLSTNELFILAIDEYMNKRISANYPIEKKPIYKPIQIHTQVMGQQTIFYHKKDSKIKLHKK